MVVPLWEQIRAVPPAITCVCVPIHSALLSCSHAQIRVGAYRGPWDGEQLLTDVPSFIVLPCSDGLRLLSGRDPWYGAALNRLLQRNHDRRPARDAAGFESFHPFSSYCTDSLGRSHVAYPISTDSSHLPGGFPLRRTLTYCGRQGNPVVSSWLSEKQTFGFVEFRSEEEATLGLHLNGVQFLARGLKVRF